jgi:hypothetical protein
MGLRLWARGANGNTPDRFGEPAASGLPVQLADGDCQIVQPTTVSKSFRERADFVRLSRHYFRLPRQQWAVPSQLAATLTSRNLVVDTEPERLRSSVVFWVKVAHYRGSARLVPKRISQSHS